MFVCFLVLLVLLSFTTTSGYLSSALGSWSTAVPVWGRRASFAWGHHFPLYFFWGGGLHCWGRSGGGFPPLQAFVHSFFFSTATLRVRSLLLLGGGRGRPGVPPLLCHPHGCSGAGGVRRQVQGAASVGQWGGGGFITVYFFVPLLTTVWFPICSYLNKTFYGRLMLCSGVALGLTLCSGIEPPMGSGIEPRVGSAHHQHRCYYRETFICPHLGSLGCPSPINPI